MHDPAEVVSIYKAANSNEAFVICNALRNEGIECQVTEINEPLAGLTIAEPDILVHLADQQHEAIIAEYELQRRNDVDQDTEVDDEEDEDDESDVDDIEVEDEDD